MTERGNSNYKLNLEDIKYTEERSDKQSVWQVRLNKYAFTISVTKTEQQEKAWENRWKDNNEKLTKQQQKLPPNNVASYHWFRNEGHCKMETLFKNLVAMWNLVIKSTVMATLRKQSTSMVTRKIWLAVQRK